MKVLVYFIVSLLVISCSHRINRIGYSIKKSEHWNCDLPIKNDRPCDTTYEKIGEIQFRGCKNSKIKSKEDVITELKKDGCAIDAELAFIKEESKTDTENACYRCEAEYYVKRRTVISSPDYKNSSEPNRLNHKQKAVLSILTGLAIIAVFLIWKVYLGFH